MKKFTIWGIVAISVVIAFAATAKAPAPAKKYLSPCAVAQSGKTLFVACATGNKVLCVDEASGKVTKSISIAGNPSGLAASKSQLFVTCDSPSGFVSVVDAKTGKTVKTIKAGPGACSPVLAPNGKKLYVCNRFSNEIAVIDLALGKVSSRIAVKREPIGAAITPDGKSLVVSNLLPAGSADADVVSACVSVIDTATNKLVRSIPLPNGSTSLRGVSISPDGKYACVAHVVGRYSLPTTQLERGWMNTNAMSVIDVTGRKLVNTVLLDDIDAGAANPWAVAFSADGKTICVTSAGTHELSIIDTQAMLAKLAKATPDDVPNDLAFMSDIRKRVHLNGNGPRSVAIAGDTAYVCEYFSDSISIVNLKDAIVRRSIALGPNVAQTETRKGEMLFADASICFQGWQSCVSCHPDARVDGLNWDLLNDGIGNPKNSKSMLLSHRTPPVMSLAVRESAEYAVRSGIRYILFATRPDSDAKAIDAYLKSLEVSPSPRLVNGKLSASALRGKKIFMNDNVGCASCHSTTLFTNKKAYNVGTKGNLDGDDNKFDTPTLIEVWRTGPFLHDGSAATIKDVLTIHNKGDRHGNTSQLSKQQMNDLIEYVESL